MGIKLGERSIKEMEKLVKDYGENYHGGFFKDLLAEAKAAIQKGKLS